MIKNMFIILAVFMAIIGAANANSGVGLIDIPTKTYHIHGFVNEIFPQSEYNLNDNAYAKAFDDSGLFKRAYTNEGRLVFVAIYPGHEHVYVSDNMELDFDIVEQGLYPGDSSVKQQPNRPE